MPKLNYADKRFQGASLVLINQANGILNEYAGQGYRLTLRQLYYQFVARGIIPNRDTEYKRLGSVVSDARLAGMLDWGMIEDRGRWLRSVPHWSDPASIIDSAAGSYRIDKWTDQPVRVEVWIEKDALVGVIEATCTTNDIGYFACRGYPSQTAVWEAAYYRFARYIKAGQRVRILHFGDHDPSGIDMTRDIEERSLLFLSGHVGFSKAVDHFQVERLALNMDQVRQYDPPPNPTKLTDTRARGYIREYGHESWELDALEPQVLNALVSDRISEIRDSDLWEAKIEEEAEARSMLQAVSDRWDEVEGMVR